MNQVLANPGPNLGKSRCRAFVLNSAYEEQNRYDTIVVCVWLRVLQRNNCFIYKYISKIRLEILPYFLLVSSWTFWTSNKSCFCFTAKQCELKFTSMHAMQHWFFWDYLQWKNVVPIAKCRETSNCMEPEARISPTSVACRNCWAHHMLIAESANRISSPFHHFFSPFLITMKTNVTLKGSQQKRGSSFAFCILCL